MRSCTARGGRNRDMPTDWRSRSPVSPGRPSTVDQWVESRDAERRQSAKKRLTIDISEELHRAIKSQCAQRGAKMADEVRELLLQQ